MSVKDTNTCYDGIVTTFYVPAIHTMSDDELEGMFVHELCHLTASTYPSFEYNEDAHARLEKTVEEFARHLIWASQFVKATPKHKEEKTG